MPENWNQAEYREWSPGYLEKLFPERMQDVSQDHRERRLTTCITHIGAGAHRDICRAMICSEEEWRAACNRAGREPGHGRMTP